MTTEQQHHQHQEQHQDADTSATADNEVLQLIDRIALMASLAEGDAASAVAVQVDALIALAERRRVHLDSVVAGRIARWLDEAWERGWQPFDVVHAVRRQTNVRTSRLAAMAIGDDARRWAGGPTPPESWSDQLATIAELVDEADGDTPLVARWCAHEWSPRRDGLVAALRVAGLLQHLPSIGVSDDPPSRWGQVRVGRRSSHVDAKVLHKVRALLAKAEGTNFTAEAEVFTAKAQELMARHAIDSAMLDGEHREELAAGVRIRRVHLDDPYAAEKCDLLRSVAQANHVRVVYHPAWSIATMLGFPVDLDVVEVLFTSLLVQCTRALTDATCAMGRPTVAFRRGFMVSYAVRIGERLAETYRRANDEAATEYGAALVPVMAARVEAVDEAVSRVFPHLTSSRRRSVDSEGWRAGRLAADHAVLAAGRAVTR